MKRTIVLIFILLGVANLLTAQTTVLGTVSGTWTSAGNPYNVTGNLTVSDATTLNIEEGVELYFLGDYYILVNGTLNAVGTYDNMILFAPDAGVAEFGGILLNGADEGTIISYAVIDDATSSSGNHGGGIRIDGCSPTISYCEISNCRAYYGAGIFVFDSASPIIEWNDIHDNTASVLGGGIGFNGNGTSYLPIVRNNKIYDNSSTNSGYGGGGISFWSGTSADVYNNAIYNNSSASTTSSGGVYAHSSSNIVNLYNNIIWGNTRTGGNDPQIYNNNTSNRFTVTFCDVEGGSGNTWSSPQYDYTNNIDSDPLFVSTTPGSEDFLHINLGSPCIDAGDPTSPIPTGGGFCIDIGAYEFIDNPLPVNLSAFYALYSNDLLTLNWATESELHNLGWNIYRNDSNNPESAALINVEIIPGAGSSSEPTDYSYTDISEIENNTDYWYWLESATYGGETEMFGPVTLTVQFEDDPIIDLPAETELFGNYPNPFNPVTEIKFNVKENETAKLTIFDVKGRVLADASYGHGEHSHTWEASTNASGVYYYKLESPSLTSVKKMLLLK